MGRQTLEGMRAVATRSKYEKFREQQTAQHHRAVPDVEAKSVSRSGTPRTPSEPIFLDAGLSRLSGDGPDAKVINARGGCRPNVVVDYMQFQEINLIPPLAHRRNRSLSHDE